MKTNLAQKHMEYATVQALRKRGLPIKPGSDYIPREWLPKRIPMLSAVHRRLKKIKMNLAEEIFHLRDEQG